MARGVADRDSTDPGPVRRAGEAAAELRERFDALRQLEARIDDLGRDRVEAAADSYRQAHRILDRYEDDATGTGDFGAYLEFEGAFSQAVDVDADALGADAFTAADEAVDKRRLTESDFANARDALEPVGDFVDLLEDRDDAVDDYRTARQAATTALSALRDHVDDLERLADMADADFDADVARLRDPIEAYDEAVTEAFRSFKTEVSARELFDFLELTENYPLVDVDQPPRELREYVAEYEAGSEPLPTLLEYADYSPSKLEHYVDDPGALRTTVAVHRTALDRIDAEPLTLEWPPAEAEALRYEVKERIPLVSRLTGDNTDSGSNGGSNATGSTGDTGGDAGTDSTGGNAGIDNTGGDRAEDAIVALRTLRKLANDDDYDRLRRAAVVRAELDDDELSLLADGTIDDRLDRARDTVALASDVLDETER